MNSRPKQVQKADLAVLTRLELYLSMRLITRTMRRFAELLDHDYDTLMIFFVVLESCFQAIIGLGGADPNLPAIEKSYAESISLGLSMLSIGEITGIPRETVRRKVKTLTDLGLIGAAPRSKNVYVPISVLLKPEVFEVIRNYSADSDQLIRAAQLYARRPE